MRAGLLESLKGFFSVKMSRVTSGILSEREYPEYEGRSVQIRIGRWIIEFSLLREAEDC